MRFKLQAFFAVMFSRVNNDLLMVPEDCIHRIGTGHSGETDQAISLVCADEAPVLLRDRSGGEAS
jgi:hypothetical protein